MLEAPRVGLPEVSTLKEIPAPCLVSAALTLLLRMLTAKAAGGLRHGQ